ncbi:hypothetical protein CEUSTIGMA_g3235.t1 [Chlamydomonas eustigma]|uniref:tRNA-binding domain-containing protein n=1 Tax=Chlamydomonas eustigma TaxID=1157962 RepID=A0A250WYV4_9CHLO|nr:hypothetical protein CEUSTIGMA_g3235.t1 [Chlamydomonas eustigma]|eukprot:GAX75792.1 hypothetical protein CEUSTIGMA_g3235.t1 [Chlamydomonas eustigma]
MEALRFILSYSGYVGTEPSTSASGELQLQTKQGLITGLTPISRHVVSHGTKKMQVSTPEAQAQIDEWLTWSVTELSPLIDDKLFKLNDHLTTRTFLVGRTLTIADLVVCAVVQPAAASFPVAQTLHFANLLRWCDLILNLAGTDACSHFSKKLQFLKPCFQEPVLQQLAPPPKAVDTSAKPQESKKGASQAVATPPQAPAAPEPSASISVQPAPAAKKDSGTGGSKSSQEGASAKSSAAAAEGGSKSGSKSGAEGGKKGGGNATADTKKEEEEAHIGLLDIRVGTIVKVDKHPNADALYLEEIDLGEEKPRQVISGLVKFVPQDKMQGRRVLVVCNLKAAKMRDVMSYGMVLCASNDAHDQVDPVIPPQGVPNGERIVFEGFPGPPLEEVNPKKKILEKLFPDMKTDAGGVPNYKGAYFMTSKGPVTSTIPNAHVA